jgi:hypothetical protein
MDKKETKQAVLDRMLNRHRCPKCHKLVPFETDTWCNDCRREKESKRITEAWSIPNVFEKTTVPKIMVERVSGLSRREE